MVSYLKAKNRELKAYALARPFSGDEEEIRYFKYYKPALTGRLLYYYRVYQIESGCPRLPAGSRNVLPQGDGTSRADDGTLPSLLPVLPQRGDISGRLLFPTGEGRTQPRKRQLRAGRGSGVLHGLRHTGGTPDLGGDAAGLSEPPDRACGTRGRYGCRAGEGTPLDGYENRRHTACLRHPCRRERGQRATPRSASWLRCSRRPSMWIWATCTMLSAGCGGQQNPTAFLDEMKEKLLKKMRDMDSK